MNIKISTRQLTIITFCTAVALNPTISINTQVLIAKQSAWISQLIGFLLGLIPVLIYISINKKLNGKTIIEYCREKFGLIIGNFINSFIILYLILNLSILIWINSDIYITLKTPDTPLFVYILFIAIVMIYAVRLGIESIARTSEILFLIFWVLFPIFYLMMAEFVRIDNIKPFFETSINPLIKASLTYISISSLSLVVLLMITPKNIDKENKYSRAILSGYIMAGIVDFFDVIYLMLIAGPSGFSFFNVPSFSIYKMVNIFDFIENIEVLMLVLILIVNIVPIMVIFYGIVVGLKQMFNLKTYKQFTFPMGIIIIFVALYIFPSWTSMQDWFMNTNVLFSFTIAFLIPLLIYFSILVDKRVNESTKNKVT